MMHDPITIRFYRFVVAGYASNNRPGDGSENELAPIQPSKHAEGGSTDEPAVTPQHIRVSPYILLE